MWIGFSYVGFEIIAMSIYITALCVMTPYSLVGSAQKCRGIRVWNLVLCLENEVSKLLRKVGMYLTTWN
jgi:hypothetical protein